MKRKSCILCIISLFFVKSLAYDFKIDDICYNITSNKRPYTVEVTGNAESTYHYNGQPIVNIPDIVEYNNIKYTVTRIGTYAFRNSLRIKTITIPESVMEIGKEAFAHCTNLDSINFPDSFDLVIRQNAFYNTKWYNNLEDGAVYINKVLYRYKGKAPKNSTLVVKEGTTLITQGAFSNCSNITSIILPEGLITIGDRAFYNCRSLDSLHIPKSVKQVGMDAFVGTPWFTKHKNNALYINNILYKHVGNIPKNVMYQIRPGTQIIAEKAFSGQKKLCAISIPNSVTTIGISAFDNCTHLTTINTPDSINPMLEQALVRTNWFKYIEGPVYINKILYRYKNIGNNTSFIIKDSTIAIHKNAFRGNVRLTYVRIPESVTSIGEHAFSGCTYLQSIKLPQNTTTLGNFAFYECTNLKSITLPDSLKTIGRYCFGNCKNLQSINIPSNVDSIGPAVFMGCEFLKSVSVQNENNTYDSRDNCNAIIKTSENKLIAGCHKTIIPNTIIHIDDFAFLGITRLTSIVIPESVTTIGDGAFAVCVKLNHISIPTSVVSIGASAFRYTNWYLKQPDGGIYVNDILCDYKDENHENRTTYQIKEGTRVIAAEAFFDCDFLRSIYIPNSVVSIADLAFADCDSLRSISIPESVIGIGDLAFANCRALTSIEIPQNVTYIGCGIVTGCDSLKSITVDPRNIIYDSRYNCNAIIETFTNTRIAECQNTVYFDYVKNNYIECYLNTDNDQLTESKRHGFPIGSFLWFFGSVLMNLLLK